MCTGRRKPGFSSLRFRWVPCAVARLGTDAFDYYTGLKFNWRAGDGKPGLISSMAAATETRARVNRSAIQHRPWRKITHLEKNGSTPDMRKAN